MPDIKAALTKKIGPLPAWGWAVAIGGGYLVFRAVRGGGGGGSSSVIGGGDTSTPTGSTIPGFSGTSSGDVGTVPIPGTIGGGGGSTSANPVGGAPLGILNFPTGGGINIGTIAPISTPSGRVPNPATAPAAIVKGTVSSANKAVRESVATRGAAALADANVSRSIPSTGIASVPAKAATAAKALPAAVSSGYRGAGAAKPSGAGVIRVASKASAGATKAVSVARKPSAPKPRVTAPVPKPVAASVARRGARVL